MFWRGVWCLNAAASLPNGVIDEDNLECSEEHCGAVTTFTYVLDKRLVLNSYNYWF